MLEKITTRRDVVDYSNITARPFHEIEHDASLVCPKCGVDSACQCGVAPIERGVVRTRTGLEAVKPRD